MLKMKERLLDEVETCRKEERCLQDYRSEMEMLMQEKMAHVEELRQIHADINSVITTLSLKNIPAEYFYFQINVN